MMERKTKYFPINIKLNGLPVLVVGGGAVALRKVNNLIEFGGNVTVIASEACSDIIELNKSGIIKLVNRQYESGDCEGYRLVFDATGDSETIKAIREECTKGKILLNVADEPELCDFIMPSFIKKGELTISVSSGGNAPFFVKDIKKKLESSLPKNVEIITELASEFRSKLRTERLYENETLRNKLMDKFLNIDWDNIINESGRDGAYRIMHELLNEKNG
jgi:precorrin-2 dehydrogenase/sirohydrochlorin ferrochelatase